MRNRFDKVAKQIGKEALGPSGATVAQDEITAETMYADLRHEPDPVCLERWLERAITATSVADVIDDLS